jgi:acetyltransferase-like isoleucine patch superfamily enzyme
LRINGYHNLNGEADLSLVHYLNWLKSVYRRLQVDATNQRRVQTWWTRGVSISPLAVIVEGKNSCLEIGEGSIIGPYTILDLQNDPNATTPISSVLRIGQRTAINEFNNIRAGGGEIIIGSGCMISQYVSIIATNHSIARGIWMQDQPWDTTKNRVWVGDDVWIGTHAIILPGVTIGTGSIIAAGAIVTSNIPEYAVAAGAPASIKKYR